MGAKAPVSSQAAWRNMSSLRNAVKRVEHKERAQPASRKKLGLLEKHKDYGEWR